MRKRRRTVQVVPALRLRAFDFAVHSKLRPKLASASAGVGLAGGGDRACAEIQIFRVAVTALMIL
eukprot:1309039-Rhodomonas_salina.1